MRDGQEDNERRELKRIGMQQKVRLSGVIQDMGLAIRFMKVFLQVFLVVIAISCAGAPGNTYWEDGNFKVYATDSDFGATKLGYDHRPGLLGLVEPEVVAAGSTAKFIFVERHARGAGRREFFIVEKEELNGSHTGKVKGPLSEVEFEEIRKTQQFPEFAWRKKGR